MNSPPVNTNTPVNTSSNTIASIKPTTITLGVLAIVIALIAIGLSGYSTYISRNNESVVTQPINNLKYFIIPKDTPVTYLDGIYYLSFVIEKRFIYRITCITDDNLIIYDGNYIGTNMFDYYVNNTTLRIEFPVNSNNQNSLFYLDNLGIHTSYLFNIFFVEHTEQNNF